MARFKNNRLIRGVYFSAQRLRDYFVQRNAFAQIADNIIITPPYMQVTIRMFTLAKVSA